MSYIYRLYDEDKNVIYVGKTKGNPKIRIRTHFSNYHTYELEDFWRIKVRYFDYVKLDEMNASIYEIYLINKHRPKYNRQFKFDDVKILFELPELEFCDLIYVEDAGVDLEYYEELYDKLKEMLKSNKRIISFKEKKDLINKVSYEVSEIADELLLKITEANKKNKQRDLVIAMFILFLGLKTSDIIEMNIEDIDLSKKSVVLADGRELPIPEIMIKDLEKYIEDNCVNKINFPIFVSQHYKRLHPRTLQITLKSYFGNLTATDLRKYFIRTLLENSNDFELIEEILGVGQRMVLNMLHEIKNKKAS